MSGTCKHGALLTEGCDDCGPVSPNPAPTQQETLSPCPMDHPIVNGVRFTDFSNEYKQHIWCYDCGLEFEGRVDETAESVAQRWNTRRAAVTAPRGDVATTARNRDVAQRVVMSTEGVLGERFDIATRHELADRITAALDAATSSLHSAERESPILAFEKWLTRYVTDCGKLSQTEYSIAYAAFIAAHPGEGPLARTMNDLAPAESTRVEGEELAIQIVGTVFDNTAASHETLKQTMIERITDWLAAAPADNDAESSSVVELRSACCSAPTRTATTDYNVCTACKEPCETTATTTKGDR